MWKWAPAGIVYEGSYGYNGWLYTSTYAVANTLGTPANWKYSSEASIKNPTGTPLLVDSVWVDAWPRSGDGPAKDLYKGYPAGDMGRFSIARHGGVAPANAPKITLSSELRGASNIAFYDGHVSSTKLINLWTLEWHANWVAPAAISAPK